MIKARVVWLLCFGALLVLPAALHAQGTNLILNPGFESGTADPWTKGVENHVVSSPTHSGNFAMQRNALWTSQVVSAPSSGDYNVSMWWYREAGAAGFVRFVKNGVMLYECSTGADESWALCSAQLQSVVAGDSLEIRCGQSSGTVYCDDASLTFAALPTPVPQPVTDDVHYQLLFVDSVQEVTDNGETFCARAAGPGERVYVYTFGNYQSALPESGPINSGEDAPSCYTCMSGYCTAADFLYQVNTEGAPVERGPGGMPRAIKASVKYDAFPVLSFTRSASAWRASISGMLSSSIVTGGLVTFIAITAVFLGVKALFEVSGDTRRVRLDNGRRGGRALDEVSAGSTRSRANKSLEQTGTGNRRRPSGYDGQE